MSEWIKTSIDLFESYVDSFSGLSVMQQKNFQIKKDHSFRVADNIRKLTEVLKLNNSDSKAIYLAGLFHDVGRFRQLIEFNTFNDMRSVDHAEYSVMVIREKDLLNLLDDDTKQLALTAIRHHNKFQLPRKLTERELLYSRILRDSDKIDILKVVTDYYSDNNREPNNILTWELPTGNQISPGVARDVLAGRLVSVDDVKNEADVKVMQLSWVYDINYKISFDIIFQNRFLEKIYNTLPKNDQTIEIYRKIKVFSENKLLK